MSLITLFTGAGPSSKPADTARRYLLQSGGEVRLGRSDFKAQGGEGSIYVKGQTAYKLYTDPRRAVPAEKVRELSVLTEPNIIRPMELLLDGKGRPAGYSMRAVGKSYALCQLFPRAFRQRHGLTNDAALGLVRKLREGVAYVHSRGILIVDLNEMNFLVSEDFRELFFIDVDSYQTSSYPATVLMESVRDRQARTFTTGSDWFSFAVVSFQVFVGIHPFKGTYPPLQNLSDKGAKLDARMRAGVSVLRPEVSVPGTCLPFNVIPPAYLDWYRAVFEEGRRLPPPEDARAVLTPAASAAAAPHEPGGNLEVTELNNFDSDILWIEGPITVTEQSVYFGGKRYPMPAPDAKLAQTPGLRHLVAAFTDGPGIRFRDLTDGRDLRLGIEAEEVMLSRGQFYVRQGGNIFAVEFIEPAGAVMLGLNLAANVMVKSTRMFEGLALQNLLGTHYASLFPSPGTCHQVRLRELDGYWVVDARLERNVLVVVGARHGRYDKLIFRFAEEFGGYDTRVAADVASTDVDFTVLESGVVLHMTDEETLELFQRLRGAPQVRAIQDPAIRGGVKLFHTGTQALIARGGRLYKIRMSRQPEEQEAR